MQKVHVATLKVGTRAESPILHSSGEILINYQEMISVEKQELMSKAGIVQVLIPELKDNIAEYRQTIRKKEVMVTDLVVGTVLDKPVYDMSGKLLLDAGTRISDGIVNNLNRRNIKSIYMKQSAVALNLQQVHEYRDALLANQKTKNKMREFEQEVENVEMDVSDFISPEQVTEEFLDSKLNEVTLSVIPKGQPLANEIKKRDTKFVRSEEEKLTYQEIYFDLLRQTDKLFSKFETGAKINGDEIAFLAKRIIAALIRDRELLTNMVNYKFEKDYLVSHSVNVTILSANIGAALDYSKEQILELAYGALLHDVGMLKVSPEIRNKNGELTLQERMELNRHPAYGLDLIQQVRGLPMTTPYIAYQSHERENGRGYPKGRGSVVIHDYARIVAVADVYESLTTDRPHRAGYIPYQAMEKVVLMGGKKLLKPSVIKAFLRYLSIFPIGSWIEFKSGERAKVVGTNLNNYMRPIVSVVYDKDGHFKMGERIDLNDDKKLHIAQAIDGSLLSTEMLDIMEGF